MKTPADWMKTVATSCEGKKALSHDQVLILITSHCFNPNLETSFSVLQCFGKKIFLIKHNIDLCHIHTTMHILSCKAQHCLARTIKVFSFKLQAPLRPPPKKKKKICFVFWLIWKLWVYFTRVWMISVWPAGWVIVVRHGQNFNVVIFLDTIHVMNVELYMMVLLSQWPWPYFKVTGVSNGFNWKFYVLMQSGWNFVELLSTSRRSWLYKPFLMVTHMQGDN